MTSTSRPLWSSHAVDRVGAEPETTVGVLGAQELERVRREVDDQQAAAGCEQAGRLAQRAGRVVEEVQHLVDDDEVERVAVERRAVHVALAEVGVADLGALEVGAGDGEHRVAASRARWHARAVPPRSWSMRPVPVPTSSTLRCCRPTSSTIACSTSVVGGVERALLVPARCDAGEVLLGAGGAAAADDGEPVEVGGDRGVVRVDPGQHAGDDVGDRAGRDEVEERPRALAVLVDHAGLGEQLQVARDARLRLPEDVGEVGDGELAVLEQRHDPQPRLLADRPEDVEDRVGAERRRCHPVTI